MTDNDREATELEFAVGQIAYQNLRKLDIAARMRVLQWLRRVLVTERRERQPDHVTYSTGEVALLMGVNNKTIGMWRKNGQLPADFRTPGGQWRYNRSRIDDLVKSGTSTQGGYTGAEVALLLGVSMGTIYRWRYEGKLQPDFVTPGGQWRYDRGRIDELVKSGNGRAE